MCADPVLVWRWKFLFSQQVYSHVVDALVTAQAPTYEVVLDLDRRIRQTTLPAVKLYLRPDEDDYNNPGLCMKGYLMSQYRSICEYPGSTCLFPVPDVH